MSATIRELHPDAKARSRMLAEALRRAEQLAGDVKSQPRTVDEKIQPVGYRQSQRAGS